MPSNFTPNYNLNQWEAEDRVLRVDFNADNAKLEAALSSLEERVARLDRAASILTFYLGQLAITDVAVNKKSMPQHGMLVETFNYPSFLKLTGSAVIDNGVLMIDGAGKTGTMETYSLHIGSKKNVQARLWLSHHQDSPQVVPLLNGTEMKYNGSVMGISASSRTDCWVDEFILDGFTGSSAQVTLPMDSGTKSFVKLYDYALFFF